MPRTKTNASKLPIALRTPIDDGWPSLAWTDAETKTWHEQRTARVLAAQLNKLDLLTEELKIPPIGNPTLRFAFLALALARKLYRGFLTTNEAKPNGRPCRGERRVKIADTEPDPLFSTGELYRPDSPALESPDLMFMMVEAMRREGAAKTDEEACEFILTADKALSAASRKSERERKIRSMAKVVATLRASAERKADGKLN